MQIGVDSFVPLAPFENPAERPARSAERVARLLEEIETADRAGLDVFGVGEHHRPDSVDPATVVLLAAAAARTKNIRLTSAVTVLSADDPVRVFEQYATLDLISKGRAEIQVGRGSFTEAFPLFGHSLDQYDDLFAEKLDLLLALRDNPVVTWEGKLRPSLKSQPVFPRPLQAQIPVWLAVGGTPESFARAGLLGLPLMIAVIGGEPRRFKPLASSAASRAASSRWSISTAAPAPMPDTRRTRSRSACISSATSQTRMGERATSSGPAMSSAWERSAASGDGRRRAARPTTRRPANTAPTSSARPKPWWRRSDVSTPISAGSTASPSR